METYGSLSKKEKVEYILEQLRLTVDKRDFIRASIVAGKINRKHLVEMPDYKVRFYTLLATVHRHDTNALELVKDYHAIYSTLVQQEQQQQEKKKKKTSDDAMHDDDNTPDGATDNETAWMEALQAVVVFLALTPLDNERQDILLRLSIDERLEKLPACQLRCCCVHFSFAFWERGGRIYSMQEFLLTIAFFYFSGSG